MLKGIHFEEEESEPAMPCRGLFFLQFIAASEHAYGMCDDKTHVPRDLTFIISNIYLKNLPF